MCVFFSSLDLTVPTICVCQRPERELFSASCSRDDIQFCTDVDAPRSLYLYAGYALPPIRTGTNGIQLPSPTNGSAAYSSLARLNAMPMGWQMRQPYVTRTNNAIELLLPFAHIYS